MKSRAVWAWTILVLIITGCGGTLRSPASGGPPWVEVSSEHFILQSDLPLDAATQALEKFEAFRVALEQIAFPSESQPGGKTRITFFAREEDYRDIAYTDMGGHFVRDGQLVDPEPHVVLYQHARARDVVKSIQHELVHRYVAFHFPNAPTWLNEGLAEFYSTLDTSDGKATFGSAPASAYFFMVDDYEVNFDGTLVNLSKHVPSVRELAGMTPQEFYAYDWQGSPEYRGVRFAHYGTAWALTHVLVLGDDARRRRFLQYLNFLTGGSVTSDEAWRRTFRAHEPALEREVRKFLSGAETFTATLDFSPPSLSVGARRMLPHEVHRLWAQVRPWSSDEARARAREDIDTALQLSPRDVKTHVVLGFWHEGGGNRRQAEATLRNAVSLAPASPDALFALSWFYFDAEDQKPKASRRYETVEPLILRLERVAVGAQQWNFLGWYWAMREQPIRGLPFARRAVEDDSSCADCFDTLALLLFQSGSIANALRAQRIAVNLSENAHPSVHERLKQFERSLAELQREHITDGAAHTRRSFPDVAVLGDRCRRPMPLTTPKPTYPPAARLNDIEGVVLVKFVVREDGRVTDVTPVRGPALLVGAAAEAVQRWTFTPAQCEGRPVASVQEARLPFVLKDKTRSVVGPTPRR